MSGTRALERQPVASTTNLAVTFLPSDVVTDQKLRRSSNLARSTRVSNWMSGRRLKRSATWLA